jgi:hypothetical protein
MPWAQASRRCGKVIEKATRCALSCIYRQLPSATVQGSNQSPVPEVKFKRCSVHKTAKPRVVLQLDNPTIEHQWGGTRGSDCAMVEEDWLWPRGPLSCLSRVKDPMLLEDALVRSGPATVPCTSCTNPASSPCMSTTLDGSTHA